MIVFMDKVEKGDNDVFSVFLSFILVLLVIIISCQEDLKSFVIYDAMYTRWIRQISQSV